MRTAIAAFVALAAVAAAGWLGWQLLAPRVDPQARELDAGETVQVFVDALGDNDQPRMQALVHPDRRRDLDGVFGLLDRVTTDLDARGVTVSITTLQFGDPEAEESEPARSEADSSLASATLVWEVTVPTATTPLPAPTATPPTSSAAAPAASSSRSPGPSPPAETSQSAQTSTVTLGWPATVQLQRRTSGWVVLPDATLVHADLAGAEPAEVVVTRTTADLGRAPLLDVNGIPLTNHTDLVTIGIVPARITDPNRAVALWGEVLPTSVAELDAMLSDSDLNLEWFHPVITVTAQEAERVWPRLRGVPGMLRRASDSTADAATSFATHVLGRVGEPTAEQVQEWGVPAGEPTGLTGLERVYEDRLATTTVTTVALEDPEGDRVAGLGEYSAEGSGAVTTSLEIEVQDAIEAALTGVTSPAAIVAIRTDGGIAGAASRPLDGYNRAFEARLAPGDAFMPVTAIALAGAGVTGDEAVTCEATAVIVGAPMTAPSPAEGLDLATAMASGCDPAVAAAVRDHEPDLVGVAHKLGIDQAPSLEIPTGAGTFPPPIDVTEAVRAGVGRGRVGMTPLQVATVAAEVAGDAGLTPWLVADAAVDPTGSGLDIDLARRVLEAGTTAAGSATGLLPVSTTDPVRGGWVGAVAGTGRATGDDVTHSWVVAVVGDLGVAIAVQDSDGDMALVGELARRFDQELAARLEP